MTLTPDPALDRLRRDHHSERIPARLRQRVLERLDRSSAAGVSPSEAQASPAPGRARWRMLSPAHLGLGLATAALLGLVWLRVPARGRSSLGDVGPEPRALEIARATQSEPARAPLSTTPGPSPARPCPIDELLGGLSRDALTDTPRPLPDAERLGLSWRTLSVPTRGCGPLPRHFLQLVPPGTAPVYRGRVLILLPGLGSPESLALDTRWYFEGLAREKQAVTVYAKALQEPRLGAPDILVGGWQTDANPHPEVDDEEYLDRIVLDLARRGVIGGGNEVWLVGKGSGAVMALAAAAHHPERYTGVAAFLPPRIDGLPDEGLSGPRVGRRLSRLLLVVDGRPEEVFGGELEARGKQWALALGAPVLPSARSPRVVLSPRTPGVRQIDIGSGASGAPGVRILALEGVDPFPPPGGADALSLAASRLRPDAMNGAEEVWKYLGGE